MDVAARSGFINGLIPLIVEHRLAFCLFVKEAGLDIADDKALNDLVGAIIVQASMDYVDARRAGLITRAGDVNESALKRAPTRSLPKHMEQSDVFSCVWFLYRSEAMPDIMPHNWGVNPDAIRTAVVAAAESGSINHHLTAKLRRRTTFFK